VHAHDPDVSVSDEVKGLPERHDEFVITPVRTLTGAPVYAWIGRILAALRAVATASRRLVP
jgi:hypothetical protein